MQDEPISRARYMQENRKMRFQEAYEGWNEGRWGNECSFRHNMQPYEAGGQGVFGVRTQASSGQNRCFDGVKTVSHWASMARAWWPDTSTGCCPRALREVCSKRHSRLSPSPGNKALGRLPR